MHLVLASALRCLRSCAKAQVDLSRVIDWTIPLVNAIVYPTRSWTTPLSMQEVKTSKDKQKYDTAERNDTKSFASSTGKKHHARA
eukprot:6188709-Pleurochrysis_carterae.AAC.2